LVLLPPLDDPRRSAPHQVDALLKRLADGLVQTCVSALRRIDFDVEAEHAPRIVDDLDPHLAADLLDLL
jgi:hypothetical protein